MLNKGPAGYCSAGNVDAMRPWHTKDAARWAGMSERKLLEFARDGVIPAKKIGGVWYFSPQKLADFFDVSLNGE